MTAAEHYRQGEEMMAYANTASSEEQTPFYLGMAQAHFAAAQVWLAGQAYYGRAEWSTLTGPALEDDGR